MVHLQKKKKHANVRILESHQRPENNRTILLRLWESTPAPPPVRPQHRSMWSLLPEQKLFPALIREASPYKERRWIQTLRLPKRQRIARVVGPALHKIFQPPPLGLGDTVKKGMEICKSQKIGRRAMKQLLQLLTPNCSHLGPYQPSPINRKSRKGEGLMGPTCYLWTTDRLWGEGTIVFNCVPTAEPTRLQMDSSKPMIIETPWLILVGH